MQLLVLLVLMLPDIPDEDDLLKRARRGDQKAIETIYERYFDALYRFIRWRVDDIGQAEDLTSEVFIKLLHALQGPNAPRHSLRGWLFRVARNVLHDHHLHAIETTEWNDDLAIPGDHDTEAQLLQSLDIQRVRRALHMLAEDQQEVLILRFGHMFNLHETAETMGKSISAIKSLQFRAITTLRQVLDESALETTHG